MSFRRVRCTTSLQRLSVCRRRWALSSGWSHLTFCRRHLWRYRPIQAWKNGEWNRNQTRRAQVKKIAWLKRTAWIRATAWLLDGGSYPVSGPQR